jgi:competence protein ComEC
MKCLNPIKHTKLLLLRKNFPEPFTYRLIGGSDSESPVLLKEGISFFERFRNKLAGYVARYPFGGYGDLLQAILLGDRTRLPLGTTRDFTNAGIAHLLAVSGLNVGIIIITVNFLLGFTPLSKNFQILLTLFFTVVYAGLCEFNPPVTRAVIMAGLAYCGMFLERQKNSENSIFIALLMIIAFDPQSLYGPSLQLSFAAVWALITLYPPVMLFLRERVKYLKRFRSLVLYVLSIIAVSALASLITAPIIAYHFGSLSLVSILTNIPAVPLSVIIVIMGMLSIPLIALEPFTFPLSAMTASVTGFCLKILASLATFFSQLPFASVKTDAISGITIAAFFVWFYILSRVKGRQHFQKALVYIPLVMLLLSTWSPILSSELTPGNKGSVIFFDVGEGESILIESGINNRFLVDTGVLSATKSVVLPSLKNRDIKKLDGIFISHIDNDHTGGLSFLMENIQVERIFCSEAAKDSLSSLYGTKVTALAAGDSIAYKNVGISVLSPPRKMSVFERTGIRGDNNNSLVVIFTI